MSHTIMFVNLFIPCLKCGYPVDYWDKINNALVCLGCKNAFHIMPNPTFSTDVILISINKELDEFIKKIIL